MRLVFLIGIVTSINLWAVSATVKYTDIILEINSTKSDNNVSRVYKKGETFEIHEGEHICLVSTGDGVLKLTYSSGYTEQLDSSNKCLTVLLEQLEKQTSVFTLKAKEVTQDGVGLRDQYILTKSVDTITITQDIQRVVVQNSMWGPLPVSLTLFDNEGKVIKEMTNEDSLTSKFILSQSELKTGYVIKVKNRFNNLHLKATVEVP